MDYTRDLDFDDFINDEKTKDAVIRNFEIIGEATRQMSDEFKSKNNHIEWREIKAFRNKVAHQYFGIDYETVWDIIKNDVLDLILDLKNIDIKKP